MTDTLADATARQALPARPAGRVRRRWHRAGLRTRVLVLVLLLLLVSCVAVLATTTLMLRDYLRGRLDRDVYTASITYGRSLDASGRGADDGGTKGGATSGADTARGFDTRAQANGTLGLRIVNGRAVTSGIVSGYGQSVPLTAKAVAVLTAARPSALVQSVEVPGLGEYRVLVRQDEPGEVITVGLPTRSSDDTIRNLALTELAVFAAILVVTAVVGRYLVRISLRPLHTLTRTARVVSDLPLAEGATTLATRVPDPAPGTEVGEVAEAFNHMLDHVAASFAARHHSEEQLRQFVADASHELRTPLAVIRGRVEYAQATPGLPADASQSLERIHAETLRMTTLVDNLLMLARLDATTTSQRPATEVDLSGLTIDIIRTLRPEAAGHRWNLNLPDEPVIVHGDPEALRRALVNLVTNAVRHTPDGTTVTVSVRQATEKADQMVEIHVADDGPGIPAHLLPRIFDRFSRGDTARGRAAGSTGLGLAIVHAIATAHHGTVEVSSSPGRTEFVLRLPAD